jgi:hypothetical protein
MLAQRSSFIVDWKTLTRTSDTYEVRNEIGRLNTCEVRNEIGRLNTCEVRNEIGRPGSVMVVLEIAPEPAELQSLACSALKLVRTGRDSSGSPWKCMIDGADAKLHRTSTVAMVACSLHTALVASIPVSDLFPSPMITFSDSFSPICAPTVFLK